MNFPDDQTAAAYLRTFVQELRRVKALSEQAGEPLLRVSYEVADEVAGNLEAIAARLEGRF